VVGVVSADEVDAPWPPGDERDQRVLDAVLDGRLPGRVFNLTVA